MNLTILSGKVTWFGKQSGYDVLVDYILPNNSVKIIQSGSTFLGKIIGKVFQKLFKWNSVNIQDVYTGVRFLLDVNAKHVSHILHIESHIQVLGKVKRDGANIVGTIHLPFNQWPKEWLPLLKKLEHAIILYEKEIDLFKSYLPKENIVFIRHGVNIDFFKPGLPQHVQKNNVLIVGHYLRNFDMLFNVYDAISAGGQNNLQFHIVIPESYRNFEGIAKIKLNKNVFFHQKLSDQELLEKYQNSYVLLIPMNDSGANSAIVQALAVGLPVITTDVGGIRSYGGGNIFPIVSNNDVDGMVAMFKKYYDDSAYRNMISVETRKFAEKFLDWKIIAAEHSKLYKSINSINAVNLI